MYYLVFSTYNSFSQKRVVKKGEAFWYRQTLFTREIESYYIWKK